MLALPLRRSAPEVRPTMAPRAEVLSYRNERVIEEFLENFDVSVEEENCA